MSFKHSCFTFIAFWISNMKHLFSCFHFHQLFGALSVVPALCYTHHVLYYKDLFAQVIKKITISSKISDFNIMRHYEFCSNINMFNWQ